MACHLAAAGVSDRRHLHSRGVVADPFVEGSGQCSFVWYLLERGGEPSVLVVLVVAAAAAEADRVAWGLWDGQQHYCTSSWEGDQAAGDSSEEGWFGRSFEVEGLR
jgi:hypothetical protein